jgi:TPR repeat protein
LTGVVFSGEEEGRMKPRILPLLLLFLLITVSRSPAQQTPDPKQAELTVWARLETMTQTDLQTILARAQAGDAEAEYLLGRVNEDGRLVQKNEEEAARWFLKSAEQGYVLAQRVYGLMSVHINPSVGERWMLRAAEQGDSEAQFWLGYAYENNWFGTTDLQEALKWYKRGAEGGNPDAQVELGRRYEDGEDVEQNYKLAAEWYRKAAEHVPNLGGAGHGSNQLGLLYMQGLGVPQDYVQAYFWFSLNGHDENAAEAKSYLSPSQIHEVEQLLREWKEQHRLKPEVAAALHIDN